MRRRQLPPPPRRREVGADHPGDRERRETAIRREIVGRDRGERGGERDQRGDASQAISRVQRRWLDARRQARAAAATSAAKAAGAKLQARCGAGARRRASAATARRAPGPPQGREPGAAFPRGGAAGESGDGHGPRDCVKRVKVLPPRPHGPTTGDGRGATTFGRFQARLRQERFVDSVTKSRHKFRSNPMNGC